MTNDTTTVITTTDTPAPEPFSWKKWFAGFFNGVSNGKDIKTAIFIGLIIFLGIAVWRFFFHKPQQNVNKPTVVVTPFAKVDKIDQSNMQVLMNEKAWEVGLTGGVFNYDNKSGAAGFVTLKRKF